MLRKLHFHLIGVSAVKRTRRAAIIAGDRYYITGTECSNGHRDKRQTLTGTCMECQRQAVRRHREKVREMAKAGVTA